LNLGLTNERLPPFLAQLRSCGKIFGSHLKYFKTFEDLYVSVIKTFKTYMQDAGKILCVMKKMREDFAVTVGFLSA
jgi:hypothetical protein